MSPSKLIIESTFHSPSVELDADKGYIEISGRAIPEHAMEFWTPVIDWIKAYIQNPAEATNVVIRLDYINSASHKYLIEVIFMFRDIQNKEQITIDWYYEEEDEQIRDSGADIAEMVGIPFNLINMDEAES